MLYLDAFLFDGNTRCSPTIDLIIILLSLCLRHNSNVVVLFAVQAISCYFLWRRQVSIEVIIQIYQLQYGFHHSTNYFGDHCILNRCVKNIPTMQFWTGNPGNNQSKSYECFHWSSTWLFCNSKTVHCGIFKVEICARTITTCSSNHKHLSSSIIASMAGLKANLSWKNIDIWCLHSSCFSR